MLGASLLRALVAPDLIRLLLTDVELISLLSLGVWRVERNGSNPARWEAGQRVAVRPGPVSYELLRRLPHKRYELALREPNRQSQADALFPALSDNQVTRINVALSRLKRAGVVTRLRQQAMNKS